MTLPVGIASSVRAASSKRAQREGLSLVARLGYLSYGVVYGLIGALALLAALGQHGGRVTGGEGAIERLPRNDWGEPVLWALAVGLTCYALWSLIRALFDREHELRDSNGLLTRVGYGVSALAHSLLAVYAFQKAAGVGRSSGNDSIIAKVLDWPGGSLVIAGVGLAVIGFGLFQLYRAIKNRLGSELAWDELPAERRRIAERVARCGLGARGIVFPIIGGSLIAAAISSNPGEAHSFGDALGELASQPFGQVLLGIVSAGLVAYGVYMLFLAFYPRMPRLG
jgi:hypothetical protein